MRIDKRNSEELRFLWLILKFSLCATAEATAARGRESGGDTRARR